MSLLKYPKFTCCMVTERRIEFMPFFAFLWNRIEWPGEKELVMVTSEGNEDSIECLKDHLDDCSELVTGTIKPGPSVGALRNKAKSLATGEWITWADDDDWYSPRRFIETYEPLFVDPWRDKRLILNLATDLPLMHLKHMRCRPRVRSGWWGGSWIERKLAQRIPFINLNIAEDGIWFEQVWRQAQKITKHSLLIVYTHGDMNVCLEHKDNISVRGENPDPEYWPMETPDYIDQESQDEIQRLRERLGFA